jgi:DNA-binding PadR family transcriptional regulator
MEKRTNDEIRDDILNFLDKKRRKARSLKNIGARPSELKKELKNAGLTENEIVTNLDFLIKNGWVEEQVQRYKLFKRDLEVERVTYRLSEVGLRYLKRHRDSIQLERSVESS